MHRFFVVAFVFVLTTYSAASIAQDAQSIMQNMRDKQIERWEGVDTYRTSLSIMGNGAQLKFGRVTVTGVEGDSYDIFRQAVLNEDPCVSGNEGTMANEGSMADLTPEQLEQAASVLVFGGQVMGDTMDAEMTAAGLPPGMLAATGSDPWATFDPRQMYGAGAEIFRGAAEAKRERAAEIAAPDTTISDMAIYSQSAKLVGTEPINGRDAYHLRSEDMNLTQVGDGGEFTIQTISMWIDTKEYVPLKMTMVGSIVSDGQTRPVKMEKLDLDYRNVPDSNMYESYRQVTNMAGVMGPEDQARMQEAQAQLAEFDKQMAQLPQAQRDMTMSMMGPQMEMMRTMASGGGIEIVTEVHEIVANYCDKPAADTMAIGPLTMPTGGFATTGVPAAGASPGGASGASGSTGGSGAGGVAAGVVATSVAAFAFGVSVDGVDVRPYYIDEEGIGVLRYSEPAGRTFQYHMAISGLTTNKGRPREVLVGQMGPYPGPDVAIFIGSLNMMSVPLNLIEIELYETEPYRPVVRFRPVVDPEKAEGKDDCGTVAASGACSNTVTQ